MPYFHPSDDRDHSDAYEPELDAWDDDDRGDDYDDRDDDDDDDDEFDDEYDAELAQDQLLERQELADFEGLNGPFDDLYDGGDW